MKIVKNESKYAKNVFWSINTNEIHLQLFYSFAALNTFNNCCKPDWRPESAVEKFWFTNVNTGFVPIQGSPPAAALIRAWVGYKWFAVRQYRRRTEWKETWAALRLRIEVHLAVVVQMAVMYQLGPLSCIAATARSFCTMLYTYPGVM